MCRRRPISAHGDRHAAGLVGEAVSEQIVGL
jgi:hypothetical protein